MGRIDAQGIAQQKGGERIGNAGNIGGKGELTSGSVAGIVFDGAEAILIGSLAEYPDPNSALDAATGLYDADIKYFRELRKSLMKPR